MSATISGVSRQSARVIASSSKPRILTYRCASTQASSSSSSSSNPVPLPYTPQPFSRSSDPSTSTPRRPARPQTPTFFTGEPIFTAELVKLRTTLRDVEKALREDHLYPLPRRLELPSIPQITWQSRDKMAGVLGYSKQIRSGQYKEIVEVLAELNKMQYLCDMGAKPELSARIDQVMDKFVLRRGANVNKTTKKARADIDGLGRAYSQGKRKTAVANVWVVPVKEAVPILNETVEVAADSDPLSENDSTESASTSASSSAGQTTLTAPDGTSITISQPASSQISAPFDPSQLGPIPMGQILINHLPLPMVFDRPQDRETILRPLRLTGLIGAYNIFALVQGGGQSGQAGAIALGLARALTVIKEDTEPVLYAAGMLMRDPRMVERKKTNLLKARKRRAWVKR